MNKDKYNKLYKELVICIVVIVIGLIATGYIIRININCEGDMFSYSGSIIGGGMTLLGVVITILSGRADRQKELNIQYMPIISFDTNKAKVFYNNNIDQCSLSFDIKNIGRAEALDIKIEQSFQPEYVVNNCYNIIQVNETKKVSLYIPMNCLNKVVLYCNENQQIEGNKALFYLTIRFSDIFGNILINKYEIEFSANIFLEEIYSFQCNKIKND